MAFYTEERLINRPLDSSDLLIDVLPFSSKQFSLFLIFVIICLIVVIISKRKIISKNSKKYATIHMYSLISLILVSMFLYCSSLQDVEKVKNIKNKITYFYKKKYSDEYFEEKRKERKTTKNGITIDFSFDEKDFYKKIRQKLNNDNEYINDVKKGFELSNDILLKEKALYTIIGISSLYSFILLLMHIMQIVTGTRRKQVISKQRNNWLK